MDELVTCRICNEAFDTQDHLPLILNWGHTLCKNCINQIPRRNGGLACAFWRQVDSRQMNEIFKNMTILQLIDHFDTSGNCPLHPWKAKKVYCKNCASTFWKSCLPTHAGHVYIDCTDSAAWEHLRSQVMFKVGDVNNYANRLDERLNYLEQEKANIEVEKVNRMMQLRVLVDKLVTKLNSIYHDLTSRIELNAQIQIQSVTDLQQENFVPYQNYMKLAQDISIAYADFNDSGQISSQLEKFKDLDQLLCQSDQKRPEEIPALYHNIPERLNLSKKDVRVAIESIMDDEYNVSDKRLKS